MYFYLNLITFLQTNNLKSDYQSKINYFQDIYVKNMDYIFTCLGALFVLRVEINMSLLVKNC